MGVCGSSGPTEDTAAGGVRKKAQFSHQTLQLGQQARGQKKANLTLLAQHREAGRHVDCYNGWKMIFLDCFLGNVGLCLEDRSALSIKWRAFLSCPPPPSCHTGVQLSTASHQEAAERWSRQSRETTAPPSWRGKRAPFVCWASHNWDEREMKELVSDSQRGATSTPVTDGLLEQGFEDKANGKDKEEMRRG